MAHFDRVPSDLLTKVANEIGYLVYRRQEKSEAAPGQEAVAPLQIGESIAVWKLKKEAFAAFAESGLDGDLFKWTEPTSFVYHQIWLRGQAEGFVRSYDKVGTETKAVLQVSASPVASRMRELFKMIDDEHQDSVVAADPVVRLLEIPPFQILALWLFDEKKKQSRVVIVRAAERYKELAEARFLNSEEFFRALKRVGSIQDVA